MGTIFDIKRFATHDGPGIRTTVFLAGCPLHCWWCHNPEALALSGEASRERSVVEVLREVDKDTAYYDSSGGGVTFSGGEPFFQPDFLEGLLKEAGRRMLHRCVDTSGCVPPEHLTRMAGEVELFLYDLKGMDDTLHRDVAGASNQVVLDNLCRLDDLAAKVWIRIPFIPEITARSENIEATIDFLKERVSYRKVCLLPYHRIARGKYDRLGLPYRMGDTPAPTSDEVEAARSLFASHGFEVSIGG